jgi:3-methylfumaryl-CoA hydratase
MTEGTLPISEVPDSWHPGTVEVEGRVEADRVAALADLLGVDAPRPGEPVRPLWHEVLLREPFRYSELGVDGHPRSSALVPPIRERRRMFGGSQVRTTAPLLVGEDVRRTARIADVRLRTGRSGDLLLVTEEHVWTVGGVTRLEERRSIVYRSASVTPGVPGPTPPAPGPGDTCPDERLLFAYSSLTGNAHRIHYDAPYAREVEGHQDLLVHGPLTALLGAEAAHRSFGPLTTYDYRLVAPCYVHEPLSFETSWTGPGRGQVVGRVAGRECLTATAEVG